MPRWIVLPLALLIAIAALMFFMANRELARVDLYLAELSMPVGLLVPLSAFLGCLIGGTVLIAAVVLPLRLRLRAQARELEAMRQQRSTP